MAQFRLWKRVVALLIAVGLFAVLTAGISADNGDEEVVAEVALQPTQVVADVPEEYDTLFSLQWGGGSLYQLKARLTTMGCMANTVWLYDNNKWNVYNQYNISHDTFFIQQFLRTYENNIPAGSLWADCFRICEFEYTNDTQARPCDTFEFLQEQNFFNILPYPIDDTSVCTDDFDPLVKEQVLPLLALFPDTCIVRQENRYIEGYSINPFVRYDRARTYPNSTPIVIVYAPNDYVSPNLLSTTQQRNKARLLYTEIHELCHINQKWYIAQALQPDKLLTARPNDLWNETPAGKEFIALTGFKEYGTRNWFLPSDSVYRDIYSINPSELSAEMCMSYIVERIGIENIYTYWYWGINREYILRPTPIEFDTEKYLTPEMRGWLETYMILPEIDD